MTFVTPSSSLIEYSVDAAFGVILSRQRNVLSRWLKCMKIDWESEESSLFILLYSGFKPNETYPQCTTQTWDISLRRRDCDIPTVYPTSQQRRHFRFNLLDEVQSRSSLLVKMDFFETGSLLEV
jgi:hypothetical protein